MYTLTADSGSTKTDWLLRHDGEASLYVQTTGLNPYHTPRETVENVLRTELLPKLGTLKIDRVNFYGSGCTPQKTAEMADILRGIAPKAEIRVASDMVGAAVALLGNESGIACILGTGSNSCLWDGRQISAQMPSLGYVLGDEGGGASLGKRLIAAVYKSDDTKKLKPLFESETGLDLPAVIQKTYREPQPARFLASLSPFVKAHIRMSEIERLVTDNFTDFFRLNILRYPQARDVAVSFTGSIASVYEEQLRQVAAAEKCSIGRIMKSPLGDLMTRK